MGLRQFGDDIHGWSRFQPERGYDFNGTALVGNGLVVLVDPVPATAAELEAIARLAGGTRRFEIVLLNAHHERAAAAFAKHFHAPVRVPAGDEAEVQVAPRVAFADGTMFGGEWIAKTLTHHKTPGETVLYSPSRRTLVVGDAVIADPVTGLRLVPPAKLPNRAGALAALRELTTLDFDALYTGDGFVLPSGGREALRRFLEKEGA